jgi:hypothetical protein
MLLGWADATLNELDELNWPLLLLAVIAALQYLYLHISFEIGALPRLIVFVLVGGEAPL